MINRIIYTACLAIIMTTNSTAQSNIEKVLIEINKNNKSIKANEQFASAKKLEFSTGIYLENPKIEFEHLIGSPDNLGNQTDFLIQQSFDFPTVYGKKKQLSYLQIEQTNAQLKEGRQGVLLKAKQICIRLVYHNKKQEELNKRVQNLEDLYADFQRRLNKGDANIIDLNKIKLQLLHLKNERRANVNTINQLNLKLRALNGDNPISYAIVDYPVPENVPEISILIDSINAQDPILHSLRQEETINQKRMELSKALALPKMEAGYRYQSVLGQQLHGVHLGLSIPLWENKNNLKFRNAQTIYSNAKTQEYQNQTHSIVQQDYEQYQNLKISLAEYLDILATINNTALLEKALKFGEISTIQYFMEINYYYQSFDQYLSMEQDYFLVLAKLYKFRL